MKSRNILVPVNGSLEPLMEALQMAEEDNARVTALKVLPNYEGDIEFVVGRARVRDLLDSGELDARRMLRDAVAGEPGARVRVEHGDLGETISRVAAEEGCDLIVIGNGRRQGVLRRWSEGRLVKDVSQKADCRVLVVDS